MISKAHLGTILGLCIGTIMSGLIISFVIYSITKKLDVLSDYATFNGYFLSLVNLILVTVISYLVYDTTHRYNQFQMMPILDLMVKGDNWHLMNISNVAARNISVRMHSRKSGIYSKWVACYSLNGQSKIPLPFIKHTIEIQIAYTDTSLTKHKIITYKDLGVNKIDDLSNTEFQVINSSRVNSADVIIWLKETQDYKSMSSNQYWEWYDAHLK